MRTATRLALAIAALAAVGCGGGSSSSSDDCDKACAKVESCATALGASVEDLLQIPGVTASNCADGCRQQKVLCSDPSAFLACTKELTCPASVGAAQSAIDTCFNDGGCPSRG